MTKPEHGEKSFKIDSKLEIEEGIKEKDWKMVDGSLESGFTIACNNGESTKLLALVEKEKKTANVTLTVGILNKSKFFSK